VPLQSIHVRGSLVDVMADVTCIQHFTNTGKVSSDIISKFYVIFVIYIL
jgi:hypothetical protein